MAFNPKEHFMPLKGKDYLPVAWRLVWLRDERKDWTVSTTMLDHDKEQRWCLFKAEIADESGRVIATGHGSESARDFGDYLEKAETKAIGRALAILGYGTQFAPELEEGERIVDSPVATAHNPICQNCGNAIHGSGRLTAKDIADMSVNKYGKQLCIGCAKKEKEKNNA